MDIRKGIGTFVALLVAIISILVFISIYISCGTMWLVYVGAVSLVFSGVSYVMHAFVTSRRMVNIFVGAYYAIGVISLLLYLTLISFNLNGIILLLFFVLISFVLIYWRYALR